MTATANYPERGSRTYLYSIVLVAVLGGLLFGYDTAVISGAEKGLQAFFVGSGDFIYNKFWHGFTTSSALIGCVIGSALSGFFAGTYGRKRSLIIAGVFFFLSALGSYYPEFLFFEQGNRSVKLLVMFNFYRVIGGIGVGLASAVCPMYIAEVAPSNLRGTLVSWNQFAIIFGQLVVYVVNTLIMGSHVQPDLNDIAQFDLDQVGLMKYLPGADMWTIETGWRYMFGSEAYVAGLFTILVCMVPMSPRFLTMKGKDDKALYVLARINGIAKAREILADIKSSDDVKSERLLSFGWMVIFIGIMLSVFQQAVGINAVLYFAPRIFESIGGLGDGVGLYMIVVLAFLPYVILGYLSLRSAKMVETLSWVVIGIVISTFVLYLNKILQTLGMDVDASMLQTIRMGVINISYTLLAIFTVEKLGRRPLLIWGSIGMGVGALGVALPNLIALPDMVAAVCLMVYTACFMFSWGPICWVLISEIFPNTIRSGAVAIAVAFQWIFNFIVSSTFVPMYEMKVGSMGEDFGHLFAYGLYGVICFVAAWFVWKLVPETKGKTLEDMTAYWRKRGNKA